MGFEVAAEAYGQARPSYPDTAVTTLLDHLGLAPGRHVVDLGAGTGIFSEHLAGHGLDVTAVEPVASMRAKIVRSDRVTPYAGKAEATGLPAGCADAVVAATAWHWFDASRAIAEVRRLLKPGGGLGLIWNLYDETVPWVAEYAEISFGRRSPASPTARGGAWRAFFDGLRGWQPLQEASFPHPWRTTPDRLVGRLLSSSAIAGLPAAGQEDVRNEARVLLRRHGLDARTELDLPYVTTVYWTAPLLDARARQLG